MSWPYEPLLASQNGLRFMELLAVIVIHVSRLDKEQLEIP
jgi:hypothetical protein